MKKLTKAAVLGSFALLIGSRIYAQPAEGVDPTTATTKVAADVPLLAPEEMKVQAQGLRDQVRRDIQRVQQLQAMARKSQDIIQLTCVNDKFVNLKAEANIFDSAHSELVDVLETSARFEAHGRVTKSADAVGKLREEAAACIEGREVGSASTDFTSPDLLDDPTGGMPFDISVEPPAFASPFK